MRLVEFPDGLRPDGKPILGGSLYLRYYFLIAADESGRRARII
jgi:hypothetical protein